MRIKTINSTLRPGDLARPANGLDNLMAIYEITTDQMRKIPETSFGAAGLLERGDLQRLIRTQIDVISPDTLVLTEEFSVSVRQSTSGKPRERRR